MQFDSSVRRPKLVTETALIPVVHQQFTNANVSEGTNRKSHNARHTPVQLLALYTHPESHNAQRVSVTDRQTDSRHNNANSRSYCDAVWPTIKETV